MKRVATACVALCAVLLLGAPAFAQTASPEQRIKDLEAKIAQLTKASETPAVAPAAPQSDLEKRIKELEQKLAELEKATQAPALKLMNAAEEERVLEPVGLTSFYDSGYLVLTSADGDFKYWLDGRINLDFATFQGAKNRLPTYFEIRRGRVGVKATLYKNFLAEVDLDFADNAIEIKDMWVGYAGIKNSVIRVGNHKAPFGMESLISSKYVMFMERSYLDSWSPDRLLGVSFSHWGRQYQFSGGVFGEAGGAFDDKDSLTGGGAGSSQSANFVGRFSLAPINDKVKSVHIGFAAAHRKPVVAKIATSGADLPDRYDASQIVKLDSRAEIHPLRAKFLSTGDMKYVDNLQQYGVELAAVYGPATFMSEYQVSKIKRIPTTIANYSDHSFDGFYASIGYILTGEHRPYSVSEGEFGRVIPKRKAGAFEVALRYSQLNLDDITSVDPIKGGRAKNVTLGATWYFNANHKILFNLAHVNNNDNAKPNKEWAPLPTGTSTTQTAVVGDKFWTIALRYQLAF